jgi:hypothetical protein
MDEFPVDCSRQLSFYMKQLDTLTPLPDVLQKIIIQYSLGDDLDMTSFMGELCTLAAMVHAGYLTNRSCSHGLTYSNEGEYVQTCTHTLTYYDCMVSLDRQQNRQNMLQTFTCPFFSRQVNTYVQKYNARRTRSRQQSRFSKIRCNYSLHVYLQLYLDQKFDLSRREYLPNDIIQYLENYDMNLSSIQRRANNPNTYIEMCSRGISCDDLVLCRRCKKVYCGRYRYDNCPNCNDSDSD